MTTHLKKYGIDLGDYVRLLNDQDGVCAICGSAPEQRRLSVDHDHNCCPGKNSCGKCVRGLLCHRCNLGLGFFADRIDVLLNAIYYLGGER